MDERKFVLKKSQNGSIQTIHKKDSMEIELIATRLVKVGGDSASK